MPANDASVRIGDPAPPLPPLRFIKGESAAGLEPDRVYVLEFWSTWCGPCRQAIPHITELAKRHPEVTFIGVNVWEHEIAAVEPFVAGMGEKMGYAVALDDIPEGGTPRDGVMSKTWLDASSQDSIPATFVIGANGRIAWIGHPMALDAQLERILANDWDTASARTKFESNKAINTRLRAASQTVDEANNAGDFSAVLSAIERAVADEPKLERYFAVSRFMALLCSDDIPAALSVGEDFLRTYSGEGEMLGGLAWEILSESTDDSGADNEKAKPPLPPEITAFARRAAECADQATAGGHFAIVGVLALSHFACGDTDAANTAAQRALRLAEENPEIAEYDPGVLALLNQRMDALFAPALPV